MKNTEDKAIQKSAAAEREERILTFWKEKQIFKKTLEATKNGEPFVFYEGPPTANGKPGIHHLEARAFKDVIPRYKTMQGYYVRRKGGWDTHGLPVELQVEKELGLQSKKEIESFGIAEFNKKCKESVWMYVDLWTKFTDRIGYWVDQENPYVTYHNNYIESLWNIVGQVEKQNLLYKDYKVVPWCPRCGTALSSHELAQGYQDVKDLSVYVKFRVKNHKSIVKEGDCLLAWTTTPWTLPGNVALAITEKENYGIFESKETGEKIIFMDSLKEKVLGQDWKEKYNVSHLSGGDLIGIEYEPLYPYIKDELLKANSTQQTAAFKVYAADFVTTTDGTGIVHTAVMYGQDDFELGTKIGLPKLHTVDESGHFVKGTGFLEGKFVKDEEAAVEIIKDLAHRGLLFKKEKYEHSYPHCWRCKTPLIYYARDSWYIRMSELRQKLVDENEGINWEPAHIKHGRFGEWLRELKDWAISRERYWGTPLPVWIAEDGDRLIVDSLNTLKQYTPKSGNKYFVMRHGQTEHNLKRLWCCNEHTPDPLTIDGAAYVKEQAKKLLGEHIDLIIASPFPRTQETARLAAQVLDLSEGSVVADARLSEWQVGKEFDGKALDSYFELRNKSDDRYNFKTADGESYAEVMRRSGECLYDLETKYRNKNILIVSHGAVTRGMELVAEGYSFDTLYARTRSYKNFGNAEIREVPFAPLPHNEQYELDLHRPYIDAVVLEKDGKQFTRVKEVMDVWFDSGAMPFAQDHYPFDFTAGKPFEGKELLYPADFISEAIDQTRGWFYTLHAVGALMGRGRAYKNVICLGHLLDAQGKKMSKSLGNIVDPWEQMEKYGADALRLWMFSVNQPGDSKNYDEKTVDELVKKVFNLLYNVLSFYELYRDKTLEAEQKDFIPTHVLDVWIMARLNQLTKLCTKSLDAFKLFEPTRAIRDFIDDLSTWYLRRSRDRLKEDDKQAKQTLYVVLKELSQVMAPFAPFAAEDIWQQLRKEGDAESVHLSRWPESKNVDEKLIKDMELTRRTVSEVLMARSVANVKVRQPLKDLKIQDIRLKGKNELLKLIIDEVNIKEIIFDERMTTGFELNTMITPELKVEGEFRELVRTIQDMRKEKGLMPKDTIVLSLPNSYKEIVATFGEELKKTVSAKEITFTEGAEIGIQ